LDTRGNPRLVLHSVRRIGGLISPGSPPARVRARHGGKPSGASVKPSENVLNNGLEVAAYCKQQYACVHFSEFTDNA